MIGIPSNLNTKRDVINLQEMAKKNLIDRKEWLKVLEGLQKEDTFNLPVLEKGEGYFIIPKTERELPEQYSVLSIETLEETPGEEQKNEVYKVQGEIEGDYIVLSAGHQDAERLELTQEEIKNYIKELV